MVGVHVTDKLVLDHSVWSVGRSVDRHGINSIAFVFTGTRRSASAVL